jgi:hypothetical protein
MAGDWPVTIQRSSRMRTSSPGANDDASTPQDVHGSFRARTGRTRQVWSETLKESRSVFRAVDGEM